MPVAAAILNSLRHIFSLSWLTGPIFDKELRVSSRRRRNYVLRFIYLVFLTFILAMVWIGVMGYRGSSLYLMSRMSEAGKVVIGYTVWFQFCVTQLVAVIMLSTSISDEVYNRTLGLLMTTPISSFQIVMGKLFSKLLQLILLLAISLPLLAIVRVFGGVPWGYVVSSLCITFTTIIFVGSLSLFFSIFTRKAYVAIIVTFLALGVILFMSVISVRRVALRQATGQLGTSSRKRRSGKNSVKASTGRHGADSPTRRVIGPAVLWKEMTLPILGRSKRLMFLAVGGGLILILGSYYLCSVHNMLDDAETHIVYAIIYVGLGILFTIVLPSTCITSEKEARSWPLLLTTTLDDKDILFGKLVGTLRRCFPVWFLLLGHTVGFSLAGMIHPVAIIHIAILILWLAVFLSCSGLYFSARFKRTTTAVIMNFALASTIWFVVPILLSLTSVITRDSSFVESYMNTNPFIHAGISMDGAVGKSTPSDYEWVGSRSQVFGATVWMLSCMAGYVSFGVLLAWRAQSRFRRNIF